MVEYKCFDCGKSIDSANLRRMVRCPYCGGKMLFKQRQVPTKVKAR